MGRSRLEDELPKRALGPDAIQKRTHPHGLSQLRIGAKSKPFFMTFVRSG